MNSFAQFFCLTVGVFFFAFTATADEDCDISLSELSKIEQTLTHIEKPIYTEEAESEASDSDECAQMLRGIHLQLRRLTQKYKLMNKGYVKVEEFQKMAKEYEEQLSKLNGELEHFKVEAKSGADQKIKELKKDIKALEQNVTKLHDRLKGITDELGKVSMELCSTYLESNQLDSAKEKVKDLPSKYVIELVDQFLSKNENNWLPVVDLSTAVPDLDDRGQVYKNIYEFLLAKSRLEGEESLLLEAEILKLNATFHPGSKITDDRKKELNDLLEKLSKFSEKTFEQWTLELNQSDIYSVVFKNAIDRMFITQLEKFGEYVTARHDYYGVRNFLKLLGVSKNYYKIAAYNNLVEKKIGHTLPAVMIDMLSIDRAELMHDPHVPDTIERMYNNTFNLLPDSLKSIISCIKSVKITNEGTNQCIFATNENVDVQNANFKEIILGQFKRVTSASAKCTSFRLEHSSIKPYIKIITSEGNSLTNINSAVPGETGFSRVGAPYRNRPTRKLDHSVDWVLNANFVNNSIKIQSDFNAYQTSKSIDHLVIRKDGDVAVARYGLSGMRSAGIPDNHAEWKFECF
uniref:Putative 62 kDa salivary secreted protein n=1 Tax=Aedes albopictus TaxID=7160 RepID=A0A1W7R7Q6_AEDAL